MAGQKKTGKTKAVRGKPAAAGQPMPAFVPPCLPRAVAAPPSGEEWVHEIKHDGYRVQAVIADGAARVLTRNALDWTHRFGPVVRELAALDVRSAIIDGEAFVPDARGISDFDALTRELQRGDDKRIHVVAFDLLWIDGEDLRGRPLIDRKARLQALLGRRSKSSLLSFSAHTAGDGAAIMAKACELGIEGIVSKRVDRAYRSGRTGDWTKCKCVMADPFVVVGYVASAVADEAVGSLVLGYYDRNRLVYAGRVGTGFSQREAVALWEGLQVITAPPPAFARRMSREQKAGVHWVQPRLVVEVAYRAWTEDGLLRHASLLHFRDDKEPEEIARPASLSRTL
ncbi:MAG: non-homologous end-joining DNA ligase [Hyphomicrobiaceae bacterium]